LIKQKLQEQGLLHVVTDDESYAQHVAAVLEASDLVNLAGTAEENRLKSRRVETKFERRAKRLQNSIFEFVFAKMAGI
jgi:tRNA G46 methylase TrmB